MAKYKILAPNEEYTGISAGVSFANGEGYTKDEWLVDWFKNKGYEVTKEDAEEDILEDLTVKELKELAKNKGIEGYLDMKKEELIKALEGVEDAK
ncbi:Rho termination factor N-terminal domain-containing protein [Clostridium sporogenes]|uniref:Rho termination factor N-terminal domain-containing protein n=1 Tax=Clostridium sporogenes TaxID=1509 RepID=UPI002238156D|nr:Rho termination factor N-terminal domain-containing protein [Clostridium sporogenes]MCW6112413.1 Rho termination factor N-terminal domain-containing protein [Clostridium sporogenes]